MEAPYHLRGRGSRLKMGGIWLSGSAARLSERSVHPSQLYRRLKLNVVDCRPRPLPGFPEERRKKSGDLVLRDEITFRFAAHAWLLRRKHFAIDEVLLAARFHVNRIWNRTQDIHVNRSSAVAR